MNDIKRGGFLRHHNAQRRFTFRRKCRVQYHGLLASSCLKVSCCILNIAGSWPSLYNWPHLSQADRLYDNVFPLMILPQWQYKLKSKSRPIFQSHMFFFCCFSLFCLKVYSLAFPQSPSNSYWYNHRMISALLACWLLASKQYVSAPGWGFPRCCLSAKPSCSHIYFPYRYDITRHQCVGFSIAEQS